MKAPAHIILFILLNCFCCPRANAQFFNPGYSFKHLNVQNGLVYNIAYHFLQDSHGYMWIGTHNGLSVYDGIKTTNFLYDEKRPGSPGGDFITSILEDSAKQVWIGNENGVDRYERATNSFTHFGIDRPDGKKENTYCVALGFVSATELWLLETKTRSIRSLNTSTGKTSFISSIKATQAQLYKGPGQTIHIWSAYDIGTIHQVYKNGKLVSEQTFFTGKDAKSRKSEPEVIHALQQNDTTVWLSASTGLIRLNPLNNHYSLYNTWGGEPVKELRYAILSPEGQLWVATGPAGIYIFDTTTNCFTENYRNDKLNPLSICSDNIVSLYFDKTGNLWCGSYGNGVSYTHTGNKFFSTFISKSSIRSWSNSNYIDRISTDPEENTWCSFDDTRGFLVLDKRMQAKKFSVPVLENGLPFSNSFFKLLFESPFEAFCISNKGLYLYDTRTNKMHPVKYELLSDEVQGSIWIKDIIRLKDRSVLFTTFCGLYHLVSKNRNYTITPVPIPGNDPAPGLGNLFQDKEGLIYIKSLADSLYIFKPLPDGKDFELIKRIRFAPVINQYACGDSGLVYFATSKGLYTISNQTFETGKILYGNNASFSNTCNVFKKNNRLWVFSANGLYLFNEQTKQARVFTVEDGLPSNEFTSSELLFTTDGRCIAATSNGLVSFYPDQEPDPAVPARPRLTGISVNDTSYTAVINPDETGNIHLSHSENTFSFTFSPVAFQHITEQNYEYMLEGYDENWIRSGHVNYTRYSKIPPGTYTFYLRIRDADGQLNPFTKKIGITVDKAFWQTDLFRAAVMALILLAGWLTVKGQLKKKIRKQKLEFEKLQAVEKERTRIATDMHDDLGAGLSRIKFLSQALSNKEADDESVKTGLEKITGYSDEMTEKMGEIIWALNEKNDTIADLVAYTRSYTLEYLTNHNIHCRVDTPMHLPGTFVPGEIRRNIFLTVKECLHNIVKHAGATEVYFAMELNKEISITIHDNGKGIDWDALRPYSNGILNMKKRMTDINGKIDFSNERGTKIFLWSPLHL